MCARVYAAYDDGLRIVDPETGGVSVRLADRAVECLSVASSATAGTAETAGAAGAAGPRVLAGTADAGLFRSVDGGKTFERVAADTLGPDGPGPGGPGPGGSGSGESGSSGSGLDAITAVATSPHDPSVVWIGTEPSRIYRSADGGVTADLVPGLTGVPSAGEWSFPPRPETHHVRWIEPCPADPDRWFVGVEAGALLVTPDGGETWIDRPPGSRRDNHALATHPGAPDRVYAAAGDGFAESDDRGESWRVVDRDLDHGYVWGLAVDPGDPETALVSAASGPGAAHSRGEAYLYRRVASGERSETSGPRFERLDDRGMPTGTGTYRAVLASGREDGEIWALHDRGLYRTRDAGGSFERVPASLPERAARALAVD
ncbi:WD40/YVTN/BNR-like repeat-containing protein [Halorubrum trueperi]|uniref:WD40/YVTN/BNR-like repeat-containing protein n=1 Tax=Halorubrum trueperi TaxID=2004704 RepID=A0ABD5UIQ3_9EURY